MKSRINKFAMLNVVAFVAVIIGITAVFAQSIQVISINYKLTSLNSATSDAVKTDYDKQKFINNTTLKYASAQRGTYLEVTARRKNIIGVFAKKKSYKFTDPEVGVQQLSDLYDLDSGNYKYEFYDYGIEKLEGTLTVDVYE